MTSSSTSTVPATGTRAMVSSAHPLATQAGLDVLSAGGNAFDAAIAIAATLNVVEPMMSGIGGYGTTLLYHAATGEVKFLNSGGRIPRGVNSGVFRAPTPGYLENRKGAKSVSTPCNVDGWEVMWKAHGGRPWKSLFDNAIRAAHEGFPVGPKTAKHLETYFPAFPDHAKSIFGQSGRPLRECEQLVQKDLAKSLGIVADQGADAFRGGQLGRAIDESMQATGGFLALQDMIDNVADWMPPVEMAYSAYKLITAGPPNNSWAALLRMGIMSQFKLTDLGHNTLEYLHIYAEITKHASWARLKYAAAPDVATVPLDRLLSEAYFAEQAPKLSIVRATGFVPPADSASEGQNTTHFVVADSEGNIVSCTQTLGNLFGAKIMPPGTGMWLNNSLAYCTFEPKGNPMDAHPGRLKMSGNTPMFVLRDNRPWIAIGTPGGHTIVQTVPQMLFNMLDFGMDVQNAITAPRIAFIEPDQISMEETIPQDVRDAMSSRGHKVKAVDHIGIGHGLTVEYDGSGKPVRFSGGADPRGEGIARGL